MNLLAVAALVAIAYLAGAIGRPEDRRDRARRPATPQELFEARMVALARLERLDEEHRARILRYEAAFARKLARRRPQRRSRIPAWQALRTIAELRRA